MNLRTAVALTILAVLALVIAWPLLPADEPPPPPPIEVIEPAPPIVVPGNPNITPPVQPDEPQTKPKDTAASPCPGGVCNTPQSSGVQYRRGLFGRRR